MTRPRLLLSLVLLGGCVKHVPLPTTPFAARFRDAMAEPTPLDPATIAAAKPLHFLFVGGFMNEGIPGYFVDNMAVVTEEAHATASVIFPSRARTSKKTPRSSATRW